MKSEIIRLAKESKISKVGFCTARRYLERATTAKAAFSSEKTAEEVLRGAQTLVVCAFSYYSGAGKGNISRYAQGVDYHIVAKEKMRPICNMLEKNGFCAEAYADSGALNERLLGTLSGISFVGENQMAISDGLGSYFFLGYIVTDCRIEADAENTKKCAGCGACKKACPLGALSGDTFCEEKCLSYITQKKGELSPAEVEAIRTAGTIWGCDICQEVCPHNKNSPITEIEEFKENLMLNLVIDEDLSNREFKRLYKNRAFSWRGKGVLLRNQKIIYNR